MKDLITETNRFLDSGSEIEKRISLIEASLSRILQHSERPFAVISPFRNQYTPQENMKRFEELRKILNSKKMGGIPLIGHWRECQKKDVAYKDCAEDQLVDVVERSFFVPKPDAMDIEEFKNLVREIGTVQFDQDGVVFSDGKNISILERDGGFDIGTGITYNKVAQAYSQYVKKLNVPFVFEGIDHPGSSVGCMAYTAKGIGYLRNWDTLDLLDMVIEQGYTFE